MSRPVVQPPARSAPFAAFCDEVCVADRVRPAADFATRLFGLMFRPPLPSGHGLLLQPCAAVHTAFCRGSMDVVFLDGAGRVLRVVPALRPWRAAVCPGARAVLELAAGSASRLCPGAVVQWRGLSAG